VTERRHRDLDLLAGREPVERRLHFVERNWLAGGRLLGGDERSLSIHAKHRVWLVVGECVECRADQRREMLACRDPRTSAGRVRAFSIAVGHLAFNLR
jgi:hypothetical protein